MPRRVSVLPLLIQKHGPVGALSDLRTFHSFHNAVSGAGYSFCRLGRIPGGIAAQWTAASNVLETIRRKSGNVDQFLIWRKR